MPLTGSSATVTRAPWPYPPSQSAVVNPASRGRRPTATCHGESLAEAAELLAQNTLVIKVQTFPFDRAAEAYRISEGGHVREKLVLIP
jgi:hypothetical protein